MTEGPVLYGVDESIYVRTVRIVLAEKSVPHHRVPVSLGESVLRLPEHRTRHPFGGVPVMDIDGLRLMETMAICRYIAETRSGPSLIPDNAEDRARMNMAIGLLDTYGAETLITAGLTHPDAGAAADPAGYQRALAEGGMLLQCVMEARDGGAWLAGSHLSLADCLLAAVISHVSPTPAYRKLLAVKGVSDWWAAVSARQSLRLTEPDREALPHGDGIAEAG